MFKILPHTADVRLQVTGKDPEALFLSALKGMAYIQGHDFCDKASGNVEIQETLEITATDRTSLLIDFLSYVLTYSHIDKGIFCHVRFERLTDTGLHAVISGYHTEAPDEDIKAVTYHEAEIRSNHEGLLETMIIFDI